MEKIYQNTAAYVLKNLRSSSEGLSETEAKQRLTTYGPNRLEASQKINPLKLLIEQFKDVLVLILIVAASISLGLSFIEEDGSFTEPLLIYAIVVAIALIGFLNEYKAEKTIEALKKLMSLTTKVRRDGKVIEINSEEVVPGDIVLLSEGQKIPADMRLITVNNLQVIEASLTGESVPVSKITNNIGGEKALGDQKNMTFSGTIVASGTAEGVVVSTGQKTELGKIAGLVASVEDGQTPMQKKLDDLGKKLGGLILAISVAVFIIIFFFDDEVLDLELAKRLIFAFTAAVALAVAAIPEGLAFVARISLALGARRMAAKNALVRKLSAVEALGSTDVIAADKTGTLTKGEMTVRSIYLPDDYISVSGAGYELKGEFKIGSHKVLLSHALEKILVIGAVNNDAGLKPGGGITGDPTEGALLVSASKAGLDLDKINKLLPRIGVIPFSSERKHMTTIHQKASGYFIAAKGAPDVLIDECSRILVGNRIEKLTAEHRRQILHANLILSKKALRVLGFAYNETKSRPNGEKESEKDLIFVGLQGMIDPPRDEVRKVMHRIHAEAGMRVLMITGDHIETAKAVAQEIGIQGEAITGMDLDKLSQAEFEKQVDKYSVYARVNPEHKIRIVQALKAHGHQVAMTGDGVNDAPAIKAADIGIAMGITGTDAAKEAADLVLLDDRFITIIDAIEEGRGIFDNVRKFVNYLLSANIAEVITIVGGVVWLNNLVLTAAQLLFINIVTDGLPAVALGSDPAEKGIMRFKPHRFQGSIITRRIWWEMAIFGTLMSMAILLHFWWLHEHQDDPVRAVSVAFSAMIMYEMVRLIGIRSDYNIRWFSNPWLSVAIAGSISLLVGVLYLGPVAEPFGVGPIHGLDWGIILAVSLGLVLVMKFVDKLLDRLFVTAKTPTD